MIQSIRNGSTITSYGYIMYTIISKKIGRILHKLSYKINCSKFVKHIYHLNANTVNTTVDA